VFDLAAELDKAVIVCWAQSAGLIAPKRNEPSGNCIEDVSTFESSFCNGHHAHPGEFFSTIVADVATDRLREDSYGFIDFYGVLLWRARTGSPCLGPPSCFVELVRGRIVSRSLQKSTSNLD
jgi:hypothetical protein